MTRLSINAYSRLRTVQKDTVSINGITTLEFFLQILEMRVSQAKMTPVSTGKSITKIIFQKFKYTF